MGSTITRDDITLTDDTGTPAAPNEDGTLINNAWVQALLDRIDEFFNGTKDPLTIDGALAVGKFGTHQFTAAGTGGNTLVVRNTQGGTTNYSEIQLGNDSSATAGRLRQTASSFTPTSVYKQDALHVVSEQAGGLVLGAIHASGIIRFATGGGTDKATLDTSSVLTVIGTSGGIRLVDAATPTRGIALDIATSGVSKIVTLGSDELRLRIESHDLVYVGSPDGTVDRGVIIDQLGADNNILVLASTTDVNHGMTTVAPTTGFGNFRKFSASAGGLQINGLSEGGYGLVLGGYATNSDTTRSSSAAAPTIIDSGVSNGAGGVQALGSTANVFGVRNLGATVMVVTGGGDVYLDGSANNTAWDDHQDVALLAGLRGVMTGQEMFGQWMAYARPVLERTQVVTFNEDGRHFLSLKGALGLTWDAMRQEALLLRAVLAALPAKQQARAKELLRDHQVELMAA